MELFATDRTNRLSNVEALVDIANGRRPSDMADVLQSDQKAADNDFGYAVLRLDSYALEVQKLRGLRNTSDVAYGVKTHGSTTLVGESEAGEDIDRQAVGRGVLEENHPPVKDMLVGAGSAYVPAAPFENYPTSLDSRDLNPENVSANHERRKKQVEQAEVIIQATSSIYQRTAKSASKGTKERSSKHRRTTSPANGITMLDEQGSCRHAQR